MAVTAVFTVIANNSTAIEHMAWILIGKRISKELEVRPKMFGAFLTDE